MGPQVGREEDARGVFGVRDGCVFASLVCVGYCVAWGWFLSDLGILEVGSTSVRSDLL